MGTDHGSDHELLIAKFRLKLKKVGKTTRPFRHDLNQIPYDYTAEVRNRFKGLDLIDRVPGKITGLGYYYLLQGIFLTQASNPGLLHCREILYHLSHQGSPRVWQFSPLVSL